MHRLINNTIIHFKIKEKRLKILIYTDKQKVKPYLYNALH